MEDGYGKLKEKAQQREEGKSGVDGHLDLADNLKKKKKVSVYAIGCPT